MHPSPLDDGATFRDWLRGQDSNLELPDPESGVLPIAPPRTTNELSVARPSAHVNRIGLRDAPRLLRGQSKGPRDVHRHLISRALPLRVVLPIGIAPGHSRLPQILHMLVRPEIRRHIRKARALRRRVAGQSRLPPAIARAMNTAIWPRSRLSPGW